MRTRLARYPSTHVQRLLISFLTQHQVIGFWSGGCKSQLVMDASMSGATPEASHARSIVFVGQDRSPHFVTESTRLPITLAKGQVLVLIEAATICGSDLHTLSGRRTIPHPCVLGHEGCGVVVASEREEVNVGERVTWGMCTSCNNCLSCSLGLQNKCSSLHKVGHTVVSTAPLFGTYSTHILCLPGTPVVPLPPALTPRLAAPINCALATMVNALSKLPPTPSPGQPGASVALVQGAGMLGMYAVALLKEAGYKKVFCVDVKWSRLGTVTKFGATPVHADQEEELIDSNSVDAVFEVSGNKQVLPQGMRALRNGGTYVFVGLVHPDSHMDITAQAIILKCLTVVGVHNYTAQHLKEAVSFLNRHHESYPFDTLLGPSYPLSDFRNAVEVARSGQFFRVVINPQQ